MKRPTKNSSFDLKLSSFMIKSWQRWIGLEPVVMSLDLVRRHFCWFPEIFIDWWSREGEGRVFEVKEVELGFEEWK